MYIETNETKIEFQVRTIAGTRRLNVIAAGGFATEALTASGTSNKAKTDALIEAGYELAGEWEANGERRTVQVRKA